MTVYPSPIGENGQPVVSAVWSSRPGDCPEIYELDHGTRWAASCYWYHLPAHPSVTMTRIVDRLNLAAAQCAPSTAPSWTAADVPADREANPTAWRVYSLDGAEVMAIIWRKIPARVEEWHQRILDALNDGRGLQAVQVPALVARSDAA